MFEYLKCRGDGGAIQGVMDEGGGGELGRRREFGGGQVENVRKECQTNKALRRRRRRRRRIVYGVGDFNIFIGYLGQFVYDCFFFFFFKLEVSAF